MAKNKVTKKKSFWLYILLGIALIAGGLILAPFWGSVWAECPWKDWGVKAVSIAIAVLLFVYLFGFIVKKISVSKGTVQVLTIFEFVILALIAVGLLFSQFKILNIPNQPSKILAIVLYLRGTVEIFRAFYHNPSNTDSYPAWWLVVAILFITGAVYIFFKVNIETMMILWTLVVALVVLGIISFAYGIMAKPTKKTKKSE